MNKQQTIRAEALAAAGQVLNDVAEHLRTNGNDETLAPGPKEGSLAYAVRRVWNGNTDVAGRVYRYDYSTYADSLLRAAQWIIDGTDADFDDGDDE